MFRSLSVFGKLSFSLLIIVLSSVTVFLISVIVAIPLFGVNYFSTPDLLETLSDIQVTRYFQITNSIGVFVIPAILIAWLFEYKPLDFLKLNRIPFISSLLIVIVSMYLLIPATELISEWNMSLKLPAALADLEAWMSSTEKAAEELTLKFLRMENANVLIINLVMIGLIPAVGEELLFRGVIQQYLSAWFTNKHAAVLVTAFLFSALHLQFFGFLPRFLLGIYLGYLMVWSENLWYPMVGHLINNGSAVVFYYFTQDQLDEKITNPEMVPQSPWLLLSTLFVFALLTLIFIKKQRGSGVIVGRS